jgi:hypothetical protein
MLCAYTHALGGLCAKTTCKTTDLKNVRSLDSADKARPKRSQVVEKITPAVMIILNKAEVSTPDPCRYERNQQEICNSAVSALVADICFVECALFFCCRGIGNVENESPFVLSTGPNRVGKLHYWSQVGAQAS